MAHACLHTGDLLVFMTDPGHTALEKQTKLQQYSDQATGWLQGSQTYETEMEEIIDCMHPLEMTLAVDCNENPYLSENMSLHFKVLSQFQQTGSVDIVSSCPAI